MTSLARTSAGTTFSIGAAPATYDASGFAAVSYTAISEIVNIGTFGKKYNSVKHNPIDTRQTIKRRGSYDNGALQIKGATTSNAGQVALEAALASDNSIAVKIVTPDTKIHYFTAQVMSFEKDVGNVDQIYAFMCDLELDNDEIVV